MISVTDIYTSSCLSWDQIVSSKVAFCQQTQTLFLQRDGWPRATVWTTGGKLHNFVSWKNETKKRCSWVAFLLPFLSYTKFILCNNKLHRVCLQSLNIFSKTQNLRVFGCLPFIPAEKQPSSGLKPTRCVCIRHMVSVPLCLGGAFCAPVPYL